MIIGTAGHIDHGKTSVVRALTGIDTDRLKEEKIRGISIDLGFAYVATPEGNTLGFVDVPGHERFVHTMLAGATGIDFVLLIVAADDGVMPQTTEHLAIIDLLGIRRGIVVLSKVDLVSAERLEQVNTEIRAIVTGTGIAGAEIVPLSTITGQGVEQLREKLFSAARTLSGRARRGLFRLAVDRSFTLPGVGTVVTGTVLSGAVAIGDHVLVSPSGRAGRVRSIHAQNQPAERGHAGDRCALNLAGEDISKDAIERGDVVLDPALHAPSDRIDAVLRVVPSEPRAVGQWTPVRLHHAAVEVGARIVPLGDEPIAPGAEAFIQLVLERPIAAAADDRFVVRDTSAQRTIGGGTFLDLRAPARKRRTPERMAQLQAHAIADPQAAIVALLDRPPGYVDLSRFGRDRALADAEIETIVSRAQIVRIVSVDSEWGLAQATWAQIRNRIADMLEAFHAKNPDLPGVGVRQLPMLIEPRLPPALFAAALNMLARAGAISLAGAWVRLPTHEIRLTARDESIWLKIAPYLTGDHRFRPPRVRDIARTLSVPELDVRRIMKLLGRRGEVYEIAQDHFFTRAAVAEIVDTMCTLAEAGDGGAFTVAQLRDRLENGRKIAIQILEFFDRHRVTARHGELRRLDVRRLDLFRAREEPPSGVSASGSGGESSPVGRPDFKSGRGREPVFGGFDSHSLPPSARE